MYSVSESSKKRNSGSLNGTSSVDTPNHNLEHASHSYGNVKPRLPECNCKTYKDKSLNCTIDVSAIPRRMGNLNTFIYNAAVKSEPIHKCNRKADDKECKCYPPPPKPSCKYLNCDCLVHDIEYFSRKMHKPFCPEYKHKPTCPVTKMNDEAEAEGEVPPPPPPEEDVEHLPYGLPPVKVGVCPVPGRPCSGPDAMARMFKNTGPPPPPPPFTIPGKISCSKEYERIRTAMLDFMKEQEKPPFPCIHKTIVDTEKTCCDPEQKMLNLFGRSCCAEHKLASMAIFKEKAELAASEKRNQ